MSHVKGMKIQSDKQGILTPNIVCALAIFCLTPSYASVYDPSRIYPNVNGLGRVANEPHSCPWLSQYLKWKVKLLPQLLAGKAAPWGK